MTQITGKRKLTIFTPSHDPKYLSELYQSIRNQNYDEWLILFNATHIVDVREEQWYKDSRTKWVMMPVMGEPYVGALKSEAVKRSSGDILVEVDHDDLLMPYAIDEIRNAFEDPNVGFVYSNFAEFERGKIRPRYDPKYGWRSRQHTAIKDRPVGPVHEMIAFEAHPHNLAKIWYAPNHVRAFTREAYDLAGGYNPSMRVLDDQDLISRLYMVTQFKHIDELLYLYRVDGENTYLKYNDEIQENTWRLYDRDILKLSRRWSEVNGLRKLDLGGRFHSQEGFESVDIQEPADVIMDCNKPWTEIEDNSVGVIIANDFLEHIPDKIHVIKEIYRVLAHGGMLLSMTPSTDGRGAFQDPTHVAFYNQNSFWYYTRQDQARFIDTPVRFQEMRLYTGYQGPWQQENNISHVFAHLLALKDDKRRFGGEVLI